MVRSSWWASTVISGYSTRCAMLKLVAVCCLLLIPQLSSSAPTSPPPPKQQQEGEVAVNEPPGGLIQQTITATSNDNDNFSASQFSSKTTPLLDDATNGRITRLESDEPLVYNIIIRQQERLNRQRSAYISPDVDWLRQLVPQLTQVLDDSDKNIREAVVNAVERQREDSRQQVFVNVVKSSVLSEAEVPDILDQLQELIKTGNMSTDALEKNKQIQVESRDGGHHHHHDHHLERQPADLLVKSSPNALIVNIIIFNVIADPASGAIVPVAVSASPYSINSEGDSYLEAYHLSHSGQQPGQPGQLSGSQFISTRTNTASSGFATDGDAIDAHRQVQERVYGYGVPPGPILTNRPLTVMEQDYAAALAAADQQQQGEYDQETGLLRPPTEAVFAEEPDIEQASLFFTSLADLQPPGERPPVEAIQVEVNQDPAPVVAAVSSSSSSSTSNSLRSRIRTYGFVAVPLMAGLAGTAGMWLPAVAALGKRKRRSPISSIEHGNKLLEHLEKLTGRAIDRDWLSLIMGQRYSDASKQEIKESIDKWKYRDEEATATVNVTEKEADDPVMGYGNIDSIINSLKGPAIEETGPSTVSDVNERRISGATMPSPPQSSTYHLLPVPSSADFDIVANFVKAALSDMVDQDRDLINNDVFVINTPTIVNGSALLISSADVVGPTGNDETNVTASSSNSGAAIGGNSPLSAVSVFSRDPIRPVNMSDNVTNSPVTFVTLNPLLAPVIAQKEKEAENVTITTVEATTEMTTSPPPTTTLDSRASTARNGEISSSTTSRTRPTRPTTTSRPTTRRRPTTKPTTTTTTTEAPPSTTLRSIASINQDYEMEPDDMFNEELFPSEYDGSVTKEVPYPTVPYSEPFTKSTRHPLPPNMYIDPNEVPSTMKPMIDTWFPTVPNWWFPTAPAVTTTSTTQSTSTTVPSTSTSTTTTQAPTTSRSRTRPTTSRRKTVTTPATTSTSTTQSTTVPSTSSSTTTTTQVPTTSRSRTRPTTSRRKTTSSFTNYEVISSSTVSSRPSTLITIHHFQPLPPPARVSSQQQPPLKQKIPPKQQQEQHPIQLLPTESPELISPILNSSSSSVLVNSTTLKFTHGGEPAPPPLDDPENPDGESSLVSVVVQNQQVLANLLKGSSSLSMTSSTGRPFTTTRMNYWPSYSTSTTPTTTTTTTTNRPSYTMPSSNNVIHGQWHGYGNHRPHKRPLPTTTTTESTPLRPRPPIEPIIAEFIDYNYDYSTARYPILPSEIPTTTKSTTEATTTTTSTTTTTAPPAQSIDLNSDLFGQYGSDQYSMINAPPTPSIISSSSTISSTKSPPATTSSHAAHGLHFVNSSTEIVQFSPFDVTPSSVFGIEPLQGPQFNPFDTESILPDAGPTYYQDSETVVAEAPQFPSYYQEPVIDDVAPPIYVEAVVAPPPPRPPYVEAVVIESVDDNGVIDFNPAPVALLNTNANQLSVSSGSSSSSGTSSVSYVAPSSSSTGSTTTPSVLAPGVVIGSLAVAIAATATIFAAVFFPSLLPLAALGKKRRTYYDPPRNKHVAASKQSFAEPPPNYEEIYDDYFQESETREQDHETNFYQEEQPLYQSEQINSLYQNEVEPDPLNDPSYYYSEHQQQKTPNQGSTTQSDDHFRPPATVYLNAAARRRRRDVDASLRHGLRLRFRQQHHH